jgi:elongation factor Ts
MTQITASMVKELREKSGAGMMDAKKALTENNGDMEAAVDWLRTKGLAKAEKKSGRTAAEGLVAVAVDGTKGAVVEVNSETDFVARNEAFQGFVQNVAQVALGVDDVEALKQADMNGKSVADTLTDLIAKIGENMSLRRMETISVEKGAVVPYVHSALAPNLGKIGVLVALESDADKATLEEKGKQLAMHIAATNPESLDVDSLDPAAVEREKQVLVEQAVASGKPQEIAEKMVAGRMNKFYQEVCLLEQTFVIDGESKVKDVVASIGGDTKLTGYVRIALGEGIEKEEEDFAAEVGKVANG